MELTEEKLEGPVGRSLVREVLEQIMDHEAPLRRILDREVLGPIGDYDAWLWT